MSSRTIAYGQSLYLPDLIENKLNWSDSQSSCTVYPNAPNTMLQHYGVISADVLEMPQCRNYSFLKCSSLDANTSSASPYIMNWRQYQPTSPVSLGS